MTAMLRVENAHDLQRARDDRLRWQCRRALLELDIVFSRFWSAQGELPLTEDEASEMEGLLELEDYPLWRLISQDAAAGEKKGALLQRLRRL